MSEVPKRAPWDQRLIGGMARQSWEAANERGRGRPDPPLREQIRSPYFKLFVGAFLGYVLGEATWVRVTAAPLYLASMILRQLATRHARLASLLPNATKERA